MKISKNKGFTLVEVLIGIVIISILFGLLSRTTWFVRKNVMKESAELQNLEVARKVINSIRRDYAVASPEYDNNDKFSDKYMVQLMPVTTESYKGSGSKPMQISNNSILLYKKMQDGSYEHISYDYDKSKSCITRTSDKSKEKKFKDIKDARFAVYYLQKDMNYSNTPLLWVSITVENGVGADKKELNLVATIASNVIVKELTNCFWNNEG